MSDSNQLIELLAREGVHSGTSLGEALGISRVAVKKRIDRLESEGFPVESLPGQGYRIRGGIELLSSDQIKNHLQDTDASSAQIEVFQSLGSTNQYLSELDVPSGQLRVALAESQPAGQGRRGRSWISAPYQNLMLSMAYCYGAWPQNPSGLSLAFGVAVHQALASLGIEGVHLKWPNDLVADNAKLAGILVSASGEAGGELSVVLGVGINVCLGQEYIDQIDQPAVDIYRLKGELLSRNKLAAEIISNTSEMLSLYPDSGFEPFANYWNEHALYIGKKVRLFDGQSEFIGTLKGVDSAGQLCLTANNGQSHLFNSAELSLRPI